MVHGAFDLLIDDSRGNSDDFMPSRHWDDDDLGNDHVDEGDAASDVEEPVNLIAKPRQAHPFCFQDIHLYVLIFGRCPVCLSFYVHLNVSGQKNHQMNNIVGLNGRQWFNLHRASTITGCI